MRLRQIPRIGVLTVFVLCSYRAQGGVHDFGGGIRIPAGSCATYISSSSTSVVSTGGGLLLYSTAAIRNAQCVCAVPVPEGVTIRQFVIVGNVVLGRIDAMLAGVKWNLPRQSTQYAAGTILPVTPFEVPAERQKKVVAALPATGPRAVRTDRAITYYIEANFSAPAAVPIENALEIFYFELYWN